MTENHGVQPPQQSIDDRLLKRRIIWFSGEVNDESATLASKQLLLLAAESDEPIRIIIDSPGGSVTSGLTLLSIMDLVKETTPIITIGAGMAASMGQMLLVSGTPGLRFMFPSGRVLMHQPSGGIAGTSTDVRIEAELLASMRTQLAQMTAERTGHDLDTINTDNEFDHWYSAQEAKDYGFCDHIVSTESDITAILTKYDAMKKKPGYPKQKKTTKKGTK